MTNRFSLHLLDKLDKILFDLLNKAKEIDNQHPIVKSKRAIENQRLFSSSLFNGRSNKLADYAQEAINKSKHIRRLFANDNLAPVIADQLEQLQSQVSAISTTLAAAQTKNKLSQQFNAVNKQKHYKKAAKAFMQSSHQLHQQLAETFEFERRLMVMLQDKQRELAAASPSLYEKTVSRGANFTSKVRPVQTSHQ